MFYKGGKKRKGYEGHIVMLVNFNLFCHKQCQLLVLLSISGIWYKILSMTTSGFCAMHFFSCTKTNRGKSTVSVHVLQIHLLQIHVLQIHLLQIHVLLIHVLLIHVLLIHVLQIHVLQIHVLLIHVLLIHVLLIQSMFY